MDGTGGELSRGWGGWRWKRRDGDSGSGGAKVRATAGPEVAVRRMAAEAVVWEAARNRQLQ